MTFGMRKHGYAIEADELSFWVHVLNNTHFLLLSYATYLPKWTSLISRNSLVVVYRIHKLMLIVIKNIIADTHVQKDTLVRDTNRLLPVIFHFDCCNSIVLNNLTFTINYKTAIQMLYWNFRISWMRWPLSNMIPWKDALHANAST